MGLVDLHSFNISSVCSSIPPERKKPSECFFNLVLGWPFAPIGYKPIGYKPLNYSWLSVSPPSFFLGTLLGSLYSILLALDHIFCDLKKTFAGSLPNLHSEALHPLKTLTSFAHLLHCLDLVFSLQGNSW